MKTTLCIAAVLGGVLAARVGAVPWGGPAETPAPQRSSTTTAAAPASVVTEAPFLHELYAREDKYYPVTVCGWVAGDLNRPATCSAHSSCVWNTDIGFVGCCAISSDHCAFYTACVDDNSKPTADDPNAYTCRGTLECYMNTFPLNYRQYGCGKSDFATTVVTTNPDPSHDLTVQIVVTGTKSSMSEVISTRYSTKYLTVDASSSSELSSSTEASSSSSTSSASSSSSSAPAPPPTSSPSSDSSSSTPLGGIIGGSIGGAAGLLALGLLFFFWRRRQNARDNSAGEQSNGPQTSQHYSYARSSAMSQPAELESPRPSPGPFKAMSSTVSSPSVGTYQQDAMTPSPPAPQVLRPGPVELP